MGREGPTVNGGLHPSEQIYINAYMISLGTGLRQLVEALDAPVDEAYRRAGLGFRARFFPFFRLLDETDHQSVGEMAALLGFTQPAVTQSLALMRAEGLVELTACADRRERRYRLTAKAREMLPELQRIWEAVERASRRLNSVLPASIDAVVERALHELAQTPFKQMIEEELSCASVADQPDAAGRPSQPVRATRDADRPG